MRSPRLLIAWARTPAPPAKINLTSAYNRVAYAQLAATFARASQPRLATAWTSFELQ